MQQIIIETYERRHDPHYIAKQIVHVEGLPAIPGEENTKEKTLQTLKNMLKTALIMDCERYRGENCGM